MVSVRSSSKVLFASIVMAILMTASAVACGQAVHAGSTGASSGGASVERP